MHCARCIAMHMHRAEPDALQEPIGRHARFCYDRSQQRCNIFLFTIRNTAIKPLRSWEVIPRDTAAVSKPTANDSFGTWPLSAGGSRSVHIYMCAAVNEKRSTRQCSEVCGKEPTCTGCPHLNALILSYSQQEVRNRHMAQLFTNINHTTF